MASGKRPSARCSTKKGEHFRDGVARRGARISGVERVTGRRKVDERERPIERQRYGGEGVDRVVQAQPWRPVRRERRSSGSSGRSSGCLPAVRLANRQVRAASATTVLPRRSSMSPVQQRRTRQGALAGHEQRQRRRDVPGA